MASLRSFFHCHKQTTKGIIMKSFLVIAIALASSTVFASKARIISLQGAEHLVDTQTIFVNPAHINLLSPYITLEMGAVGGTATGANGAEGGFAYRLSGGSTLGVYLGHDNTTSLRDGVKYIKQRNPVEVTYGFGNMGFAGSVSTTDDKLNGKKETTIMGKFGMTMDNMSLWSSLGLISEAQDKATDSKMVNAPSLVVGADFTADTNRFYGEIGYVQGKETIAGASNDDKNMGVMLGWLNRGMKNQAADIYYGAALSYGQRDKGGKKITTLALPLTMGLEYTMNTWAIFRGSVKQNFILGETKDETAANTDAESVAPDTQVAAGLGFKYNQITLDGALTAATNGQINGNAFISQASVTYNF